MIKSVFHLFKIHGEMIFGNPSIIVKNMLSKRPKALNAVNMVFGSFIDHVFQMIHLVMFTPAFQGIVASEPVRKVDRALSGFLPDNLHQFIGRDSFHHPRIDPAITLQKAEYNALPFEPRPRLPLRLPPK